MTTLLHVVGGRANLLKVAPVLRAGDAAQCRQVLVHSGESSAMAVSDSFFADLGLPEPNENLGAGSGKRAEQTARAMLAFEPVLDRHRPDWVVVYGDVDSTVATALGASKRGIRVAHVEAGLRSGNRAEPEEINRILTDQIADLCLTPSRDADQNLMAEGIPQSRIRMVGSVIVDTLLRIRDAARGRRIPEAMGLSPGNYAFVSLHRASNVDNPIVLADLLGAVADLGRRMPVVFAMHPHTRARLREFGIEEPNGPVTVTQPLGYLETIGLLEQAALVFTDSGVLQEETTVLGIPCLTAQSSTERPVTISEGTNRLVASRREAIRIAIANILASRANGAAPPGRPEKWDGRAGERVIAAILGQ